NIVVDGMQRNLTLHQGVVRKAGMVIKEPEAGIFLYNGNFDMVFQRRSEYCLASTPQLIRIPNLIKVDSEYSQQRAMKDSLSAKPQRATLMVLLRDILVSWDGHQPDKVSFELKPQLKYELVKVVNSWQNCLQKYGHDVSKNGGALNADVLPP
ncbi:hypothetical protein Tco_1528706, partial [Tanacetum coccineum]